MNKKEYMQIYCTALKECIIDQNTNVFYEEDCGKLTITKNDSVIHLAKSFDIDYDTEAKLLMDYIKNKIKNK